MSITRRGLLGALVGLPFAARAALGAPVPKPKIDDIITIPKKPLPAFSQKHISGIGNALLNHVERSLACRGIRYTSGFVSGDRGLGDFFLIPWSEDKKSYRDIVQEYAMPSADALAPGLIQYYGSEVRWIGVQLYYHPDGLAVSVLVTRSENPPITGNAIYSEWVVPVK